MDRFAGLNADIKPKTLEEIDERNELSKTEAPIDRKKLLTLSGDEQKKWLAEEAELAKRRRREDRLEQEKLWPPYSWKCKRCGGINKPDTEVCTNYYNSAAGDHGTEEKTVPGGRLCNAAKSMYFDGYVKQDKDVDRYTRTKREKQMDRWSSYRGAVKGGRS